MKKLFTLFFTLSLLLSFSYQSFALNLCFARNSGDWSDPGIWDCYDDNGDELPGALPVAGDIIIVEGPHIVYYYETIDLSTIGNDKPTVLLINGELKNYSQGESCDNDACNIDILLDEGSEIAVEKEDGLTSEGPNNGDKEVIIGGAVVLNIFPFGPGVLPEDSPLPVRITSFEGEAMETENLITWETESEVNTSIFLVERSFNGVDDFREISRVKASGKSDEFQFYKTVDSSPVSSSYYRLKIIYFDESFEYSDVIVIERDREIFDLDIYPVPANDQVNVIFSAKQNGKAIVTISNGFGVIIKREKVDLETGINRLDYNLSSQGAGLYFISIDRDSEMISKMFLVN